MIFCLLDGDKVFPSLSSNIKITRENPELKDKGSYTLDVTFPLSVYENKKKFGHLNRIDVSMVSNDYESATLYVNSMAVISGIGVVTSVSNTEVKLQIMDANSEFKYASGFDKVYIDDMFSDWNRKILGSKYLPGNPPKYDIGLAIFFAPTSINYDKAIQSQNYVGDKSIGIYTPVNDETNGRIVNEIVKGVDDGPLLMIHPECQPNLMYVMRKALLDMGYVADLSVIDIFPWNSIYIINTGLILPHWTLERFITEFKALFGLSLHFEGKIAKFGKIDYDAEPVSYECLDEFTSDYDDEGLSSNSTSNLRYNLYDSAVKTVQTEIPDNVMEAFAHKDYKSESEMFAAFPSLTDAEKAQSIFVTPTGYFYAHTDDITESKYELVRAGQFNKLVRDADNDNADELGIVPVTMTTLNVKFRKVALGGINILDFAYETVKEQDVTVIMPSAESEGGAANDFPTVQQALESGETGNNSRSESERMEVFFLGTGVKNFTALEKTVKFAAVGTDPTIDNGFKDKISFALDRVPEGVVHIGQLHAAGSRINGKNQRCIKFISDDIPDPTKIFMFKNKRFVCEKIELQLDEKGIESVKTGYFYEILS